jgi:hypothetical protein
MGNQKTCRPSLDAHISTLNHKGYDLRGGHCNRLQSMLTVNPWSMEAVVLPASRNQTWKTKKPMDRPDKLIHVSPSPSKYCAPRLSAGSVHLSPSSSLDPVALPSICCQGCHHHQSAAGGRARPRSTTGGCHHPWFATHGCHHPRSTVGG